MHCVLGITRTEMGTRGRAERFVCNIVIFIILASTTAYCNSLPGMYLSIDVCVFFCITHVFKKNNHLLGHYLNQL